MSLAASARHHTAGPVEAWRSRSILTDTLVILACIGALLLAAIVTLHALLDFGVGFAVFSLAAYTAVSSFVVFYLDKYPHARFGAANAITAFRASMTCLLGGLLFETDWLSAPAMEMWMWAFVAAAIFALSLDGFDGWLARRAGQCSSFGGRFDMEIDAALILSLSVMAFALGKAGAWVILIGVMRHLFLLGRLLWPRLRGELEDSYRRKTICVMQIIALCIILTPVVQQPYAPVIAAVALACLVYSFAIDILDLLGHKATT
ncbi:CDP-alcohol phosphatidyltransferase family protein [Limoniibacter endophyticus]|uniref:Membrane protein n=1 Tax=Limoniibacter endophyticus TaxID=1565040 RepID=A0A8J3GH52_9HYPH|nr:CDP-alcohol phosphatidyltransferase family protein [Limoniibacter endophyticus]GHC69131.1 membrane protein [Limoniibacter endophyticus]